MTNLTIIKKTLWEINNPTKKTTIITIIKSTYYKYTKQKNRFKNKKLFVESKNLYTFAPDFERKMIC